MDTKLSCCVKFACLNEIISDRSNFKNIWKGYELYVTGRVK